MINKEVTSKMVYKGLIKMYSQRKEKIKSLLDDKTVSLNTERVTKLEGAVDEISMFINVLEQYQEKTVVPQEEASVHDMKGAEQGGFLSKLNVF